jgi:outer membrane protein assembly factor BamB
VWTAQVGQGFSSVSVKGNRVYTMGHVNGQDVVTCLDAGTGRNVWQHKYASSAGDYAGPRATPTIDGPNVYTMSREGKAHCLNAASGKLVWQQDLQRMTGGEYPQWGFAGSPLVEGNLVIYNVGTAGIALDKTSGKQVWATGSGRAGYSSPFAFGAAANRAVALFTAYGVVARDAKSGRALWQHPWQTSYDVNAADPLVVGNEVFISSNYGKGGALLRLSGNRPSVVWENRNMKNHFNTSVMVNNTLFGNDENTLKAVDWKSGQEKWRMRGMGKGGLIAADWKLIVLTERGELVIIDAKPDRFNELARAQVLNGTCWTHPVLANGFIYARSHEGTLVCVDVRAAK